MTYQAGPYDVPHLYLQWGGSLPGGDEWSCGLRLHGVGDNVTAPDAAHLNAAAAAVQAMHTHANTMIGSRALLTFVKLNPIDVNGHYRDPATVQKAMPNVAGGSSQNGYPLPNQVALAVTLETGFSRGPAHKGRFYLPMPTAAVEADGLISVADRAGIATKCTEFITALNAIDEQLDVAVFSRKLGAPAHRIVTGVKVGRVMDTQRRRRKALPETY